MRKILQSPQGIRIAVFRLKYNGGFQCLYQSALPGYAELGGKITADMSDNLYRKGSHSPTHSIAYFMP